MLKRLLLVGSILFSFMLPAVSSPAASPFTATVVAYHARYFDTASEAQRHCPRDVVVWLNTNSGIYHYKGERWYARTRHGAFVCEKEAIAEGDRSSRNGQ